MKLLRVVTAAVGLLLCLQAARGAFLGDQNHPQQPEEGSEVLREAEFTSRNDDTEISPRERREIVYYDIYDEGRASHSNPNPNELRTIMAPGIIDFLFKKLWIVVQQALVIGLLILALIYSIYVLIVPLTLGRSLDSRAYSLDGFMDNRVAELVTRVMKRLVRVLPLREFLPFFAEAPVNDGLIGKREARYYHQSPAYYDYSNVPKYYDTYVHERQDTGDDDNDDELEEEIDPEAIDWVQLSVVGLFAFGFAILGAQLASGLTNPLHFPQVIPYPRRGPRSITVDKYSSYDNLLGRVLKSINPVDLTFGVMNIGEDSCRQRAICELRRTVGLMSIVEGFFDSYVPSIYGMKKYQKALESGRSKKKCSSMYPTCRKNPVERLPRFLRMT